VLRSLLLTSLLLTCARAAEPNYDQHIKPILRQHCLKCHGDDEQKSGLNMQSYAAAMKGGSGGKIAVPGRSSQSVLYRIITDPDDDSRMPPNKPMIPQKDIALIQQWIDGGLLENAGSKSMVAKRDTSFRPAAHAGARPVTPAMPGELPPIKTPKVTRPLPVLSMDTSPWAPLLAVAGQEHVRLQHTETEKILGHLPFPEGVPNVIRFSRDGSVLMVAGGRPVESGKVVLFDVKTGKRLAEIGDELDAIIAADLSADHKLVALGGSGKVVKVYSTVDGQLQYKIEKHTDWITSVAFSPNGSTLATADRAGGLHLWDAKRGGIRLSLLEHKAAVRALDWRSDGKLLASAGEDGRIIWWNAEDGWPTINKSGAHTPQRKPGVYGKLRKGVLATRFDQKGRLATVGRDRAVRVWDEKGKQLTTSKNEALPLAIAVVHTGARLIIGDQDGTVRFWKLGK
jgi:sugar lactone lactonase YvrE